MQNQQELEQLIAENDAAVVALQRQRIFASDPTERRQLELEIQRIQRQLFELRRQLGSLWEPKSARGGEMTETAQPLVFISYCRADQEWLDRLLSHWKRSEPAPFDIWDDSRIAAGMRWRDEIETVLKSARVAVLLVSADYLASDFIARFELPILLEVAESQGTHILPIIVSPCAFERSALSRFQAVNSSASPLTRKSPLELQQTFSRLAKDIDRALTASTTA